MPTGTGEIGLQRNEVMPFFCRAENDGGLGYRETSSNVVTNDLFIPSQLAEFVSASAPREWARLLRAHHNDAKELETALVACVREKYAESSNAAVFLNSHKTMTFEGETIPLFYESGSELVGDANFKRNIFAAVEEKSHRIKCVNGDVIGTVRPDISFFVNGIYLGYLELKCISQGQTARSNGRDKVFGDYLRGVQALAQHGSVEGNLVRDRRAALSIFEKALHLTTSDINETYVLRIPGQFFDEAYKGFKGTMTISEMSPTIEKTFKAYPLSNQLLSSSQRFEEVMTSLYSKRMVEREIRYYNFLQYKYEKRPNGTVVRTSNSGTLISPRPKQKFGCDKILARVREMLDHEHEPTFYRDREQAKLKGWGFGDEEIAKILETRDRYSNNKDVYSLLLQYAAGFGKSNIIGWTALQLKDMRHQGGLAFDKILIVVDRLQLRDQIDMMMLSMNIDKSMFVEAKNQKILVEALGGPTRIVVVNIQKFLDLREALAKAGKTLGKMRVAFLIDEIHRSNTGEANEEMVDIFEQLQGEVAGIVSQDGEAIRKKNIIIGFTATPTDTVLARFGELYSSETSQRWVPFDAYTMKEAIEDGFILDPTKHIIPVVSTMTFAAPEGYDPNAEQVITIEKTKVYEDEKRMDKLAEIVVNRCLDVVYGKIRGCGKAMLAVTSIPIAVRYFKRIKALMAEKCVAGGKYETYADAPVSIVYSDNQESEKASSLMGGDSEEKVIKDFCKAKNGIIIVVDKLQTGFDEPKLHTLFLDKEITGVNAIQTISRVNRKCKHKNECHIIDLSWKNVNIANINTAFKDYCGINVTDFNAEVEERGLLDLHRDLLQSEPAQNWWDRFRNLTEGESITMAMESSLKKWILDQFVAALPNRTQDANGCGDEVKVNQAVVLRNKIGEYVTLLNSMDGIYEVDAKLKDRKFLDFLTVYCRIFAQAAREWDAEHPANVIHPDGGGDDQPPLFSQALLVEPEEEEPAEKAKGVREKGRQNVLEIILKWNQAEALAREEAEQWVAEVGVMFSWLANHVKLMSVIRDPKFSVENKKADYMKAVTNYKVLELSRRADVVKADLFRRFLDDNAEQFVNVFMDGVESGAGDCFDF